MDYKVVQSETVFEGKVFNVQIDQVVSSSGKSMRVDVVSHSGAVVLIPIDGEGHIWFVRQYRHPAGTTLMELPAGTLDPGEDPESCAIRECREEIGMSPGNLLHLGGAFMAPGYSTEYLYFFLAENLKPSPLTTDMDEELHVERLTWNDTLDQITQGGLRDAKSLAGLFLAREFLEKPPPT